MNNVRISTKRKYKKVLSRNHRAEEYRRESKNSIVGLNTDHRKQKKGTVNLKRAVEIIQSE